MSQQATTNKACKECKRKKTKCDGRKPHCSLCSRIGAICLYPRRKPRGQDVDQEVKRRCPESGSSAEEGQVNIVEDMDQSPSVPVQFDLLSSMNVDAHRHDATFEMDDVFWNNIEISGAFDYLNHGNLAASAQVQDVNSVGQQEIVGMINECQDRWQSVIDPGIQHSTHQMILDTSSETSQSDALGRTRSWLDSCDITTLSDVSSTAHSWLSHPELEGSNIQRERFALNIPFAIVENLIECFFQRVQTFLPLFHKPTFYATHLESSQGSHCPKLPKEVLLILYGMMALSARFSTLPQFDDVDPCDRGTAYAHEARAIYVESFLSSEGSSASLKWLQGCILLAYYNQSCNMARGSDLSVASCIKLAYELKLHTIDEDKTEGNQSSDASSNEEWIRREEKRRAWWATWELDGFDSVAFRRPFAIDKTRVFVMLPVSDKTWFAGSPVKSAVFNPNLLQCWKVLKDSPNKDERAWFLIGNYIALLSFELCQHRKVSQQKIDDIDIVISCFTHLFHERFQSTSNYLKFDENSYATSNWIVLTRLMTLSARITLCLLNSRTSTEPVLSSARTDRGFRETEPLSLPCIKSSYQSAHEAFRLCQSLQPEYIRYLPPTMACLFTGPASIMLRYARHLRREQDQNGDQKEPSIQEDLIVLILGQFAIHWNIGFYLLEYVRQFREKQNAHFITSTS